MNDDQMPPSAGDDSLRGRVSALRQEHHDMDVSIRALELMPRPDQLMIARLKRRKLALRDEITALADRILPDIIA
ncbi:MAG TPA: DUF465 domain-containing protein [Caulobacteraceae bacterium]|jgi:hypothetical protein|nr:DUF465 domain-containing protein [Caulobacteraceae bacterium]